MSSLTALLRRVQAEQRRQQRAAHMRQKELERRLKELAKLSALEQARLEVEAHENALDVLLSVHKEQSALIEWARFSSALAPHEPLRLRHHAFSAALRRAVAPLENAMTGGSTAVEDTRDLDERDYRATKEDYGNRLAEWQRMRVLANRVLAGEPGAYSEAISEFSSIAEIPGLGSSLHVTVYSPRLIGCVLTVSGREVIPTETKSLTAAGKVSVKTMPKPRFHEIYQDYVCGCVLRLAREMFALLPIDEVLVTASVNGTDTRTGRAAALPVISTAIARTAIEQLDFERLDPSDSMEIFPHRGDVMASRKSGAFVPIVPLTPADLTPIPTERLDLDGLLANLRQLREEIGSELKSVTSAADENGLESVHSL